MKLHWCFCRRTRYIDLWQQHIFVRAKLSWNGILYWGEKRCCFMERELSNSSSHKELGPLPISRSGMLLKQSVFCFTICHFMQSMLWILSVTPVPVGKALNVVVKVDKWTHFCNFVCDDLWIVKQMSFWRFGDWAWQTFCYMPITDSISQLIDGVRLVFGRLCLCHSVIALGGRFTWNWSKVAVNHVLLNAARAVWSPVFFTHHRPHHVSGVRGPENGSLFFRPIAYVIYSGSCLIPLRYYFDYFTWICYSYGWGTTAII